MKRILIFLLMPFLGQAQFFSGEIIYKNTIIPKSDTTDISNIINQEDGVVATYIITSKQYKSTYHKNGKYQYSYTYDDATKRMYDDYAENPYITYRDSRKTNAKYYEFKVFKDSTTSILGHHSYMVISDSDYGKSKTFYSDDIRVDPNDFKGHKVGNWYNNLKKLNGAILLKSITEHENYYEVKEAIKINERKITPKEFELPNKPIAASYTALDEHVQLNQPTNKQIKCYQKKVKAAPKPDGKKYKSYVSFLLKKNGEMKFMEPHEKDEKGFYKVVIDIVSNCGLEFIPGKINGLPVDSKAYFPVEFIR